MSSLLVLVYRVISEEVWDSCLIRETRLQAFLDAWWRILLMENDIRQQMIEDTFTQQTQPFNAPRIQP